MQQLTRLRGQSVSSFKVEEQGEIKGERMKQRQKKERKKERYRIEGKKEMQNVVKK